MPGRGGGLFFTENPRQEGGGGSFRRGGHGRGARRMSAGNLGGAKFFFFGGGGRNSHQVIHYRRIHSRFAEISCEFSTRKQDVSETRRRIVLLPSCLFATTVVNLYDRSIFDMLGSSVYPPRTKIKLWGYSSCYFRGIFLGRHVCRTTLPPKNF